ncbi:MAG TPA: hypothetical protein VK558_15555 [Patescibacteria group bacterium]|nr:hypothetical protein [Patescibacteria group bacterium]
MKISSLMMVAVALAAVAAPAQAAGLKKGYAMCHDQKSLERLVAASVQQDEKTFRKLMDGPCRAVRGGERARITSRGKGMVRVSVKGLRGSWWTVAEAVR